MDLSAAAAAKPSLHVGEPLRLWEAASRLERRPELFALRLPIGHLLTSIPIRKRDVVGIRRQAAQEAPNMHAACRGADENSRLAALEARDVAADSLLPQHHRRHTTAAMSVLIRSHRAYVVQRGGLRSA